MFCSMYGDWFHNIWLIQLIDLTSLSQYKSGRDMQKWASRTYLDSWTYETTMIF